MIFAEAHATWLLIAHAVLGVAVVAATTHLVLWMRGYPRGRFHRIAAVRRFSRIAFALYAISFLLGNLLYPAYKVGVRAEFLDSGAAVTRSWEARLDQREEVLDRYRRERELYPSAPRTPLLELDRPEEPLEVAHAAVRIARWFDVKEHWVALGFILSLAALVLLHRWDPRRDGPQLAWFAFGCATGAAACTWAAALIGLLVSATRAVAPL